VGSLGHLGHLVTTPLQEYRRVGGGINVDIVEITVDVWQRHQALVHDFEPEPGQVGEHVHAKVTIGKARQVFKMA